MKWSLVLTLVARALLMDLSNWISTLGVDDLIESGMKVKRSTLSSVFTQRDGKVEQQVSKCLRRELKYLKARAGLSICSCINSSRLSCRVCPTRWGESY